MWTVKLRLASRMRTQSGIAACRRGRFFDYPVKTGHFRSFLLLVRLGRMRNFDWQLSPIITEPIFTFIIYFWPQINIGGIIPRSCWDILPSWSMNPHISNRWERISMPRCWGRGLIWRWPKFSSGLNSIEKKRSSRSSKKLARNYGSTGICRSNSVSSRDKKKQTKPSGH